jgi:serine/threonine protein kinase
VTLAAGMNLGPYRIVEQVGRGGMATVYKGFQPSLHRFVAIKVLPEFLAADPTFRTRFEQEAVAIARLRHPNILTVYDHGEEDGVAYIVTEFIEGGTLADQLGKSLPADYVAQVLGPIASALDYAHARGVVHRDLKPTNILLASDGTPILGDFGLALMMTASQQRLTQSGTILGTPEYMSPEQCEGADVTPSADIYALGVIAYEMLTGRVPFSASTPAAVLVAQIKNVLPSPRQLNPELSSAVELALLKALAKAPADRFRTAGGFVRELGTKESTVSAPASTRPRPGWAPVVVRGRGLAVASAFVILVALLAAIFVLFRPQLPDSVSGPRASPTPAATPSPSPLVKGPLVFQARLDGSSAELTPIYQVGDKSASRITFAPGAIEFAVIKQSGNAGAGLNFHQLARYVSEIEFAVQPGSNVTFWWDIRTGAYQVCNHQVEIDTARETMHLACFLPTLDNSPSPSVILSPDVKLPHLQEGRTFTLSARVDPPLYEIYVNQDLVISKSDAPHTDLAEMGFACFGEGGVVRVSGIRIYALPD